MTRAELTYGAYLHLDELLGAQHPVSEPEHHDEMLFIVQHQTSELWLKLALHELRHARTKLDADELPDALKTLDRVKRVLGQLAEQWSVLATLTPSEYAGFRSQLGTSSGFQSWQYRAVEAVLGDRDPRWLSNRAYGDEGLAQLRHLHAEPSIYDAFWRWMARTGLPVPADVGGRDPCRPWRTDDRLVALLAGVYADPASNWDAYEAAESLVDVEDGVQLWRFRHLTTVRRIIGDATGTGGTGIAYLRSALDRTFFPELYTVRSSVAAAARP